jgi:hypothetical protein
MEFCKKLILWIPNAGKRDTRSVWENARDNFASASPGSI